MRSSTYFMRISTNRIQHARIYKVILLWFHSSLFICNNKKKLHAQIPFSLYPQNHLNDIRSFHLFRLLNAWIPIKRATPRSIISNSITVYISISFCIFTLQTEMMEFVLTSAHFNTHSKRKNAWRRTWKMKTVCDKNVVYIQCIFGVIVKLFDIAFGFWCSKNTKEKKNSPLDWNVETRRDREKYVKTSLRNFNYMAFHSTRSITFPHGMHHIY